METATSTSTATTTMTTPMTITASITDDSTMSPGNIMSSMIYRLTIFSLLRMNSSKYVNYSEDLYRFDNIDSTTWRKLRVASWAM